MKNTFLVTFITVCCSLFIFSIDAARLFIALDLPPNVNSSIMNFQSSLSKKLPLHLPAGINFDKSQINLTILFIGEADRSKAETALLNAFQDKENKSGLCQKWTLACNPSLSLNQYIDLKASPQNLNTFNSFIEKIKISLEKQGINIKESTDPHVTLIKCKSPLTTPQQNILEKFLQTKRKKIRNFSPTSISLYESHEGKYTPLLTQDFNNL